MCMEIIRLAVRPVEVSGQALRVLDGLFFAMV